MIYKSRMENGGCLFTIFLKSIILAEPF